MRRLLNHTLVITLLIPAIANAQNGDAPLAISLNEAMDLAVKNNVQAKNARLDRENQKAINAEVTGIAFPQISAKGEYNDYLNPVQSFVPAEFVGGPSGTFIAVPFTPKHSATASATASQVLFDGSVMVALQARKALLKLYDQQAQLTEEEIRYNVQKAYFAIVVAEKQFQTLKETAGVIRNLGKETKAMYENGLVEKLDADRAQVSINNIVSDSIQVAKLISVTKQMLKYQLGLDMDISIELTDKNVQDEIDGSKNLLLADNSYNNRTEFMLLQSQLNLNQYDLKRHRLSGLPSLGAFGTAAYTYQTNTFDDLLDKQYIFYSLVGLQLNIPIFDGWQRRSRVKQAKISIQKTKNSIDDLKRGIDLQVTQGKTTLKNAIYTLENENRNYSLSKEVLDVVRKKYDAGLATSFEVSQAQGDMLSAQTNYFNAMLEVINAEADLLKAMGNFK